MAISFSCDGMFDGIAAFDPSQNGGGWEVNGYTNATERRVLLIYHLSPGLLKATDGTDREGPIDMASIN